MSGRSRARKRAAQLSADQLEAEGYAEQDQTAKHHSTTPEVQALAGGAAAADWDDEADALDSIEAGLAAPTDTLLAVQLLRNELKGSHQAGAVRVVLRSQIYALVHDHTEVDRELHTLSQANQIQAFKLPTATDDYAYMWGDDYLELAAAQLAALNEGPPDEQASQAVEWFLLRAVPACYDTHISRARLLKLLSHPSRDEVLERETAGMPHAQAKELSTVSKAHLDVLVRLGLLARQSSDRFSFAIPGLGPLMKTIADGRKEVLQLLRRRLHHSMLLQELESVKLRSSKFSTLFHIRDCIGRELVRLVNAPGGKLVELTRRQK